MNKENIESPNEMKKAEEIAKEILYYPVTNNQAEESIRKGAELIKNYCNLKYTREEMTNFNVDAVFNAINKPVESPNLQEGKETVEQLAYKHAFNIIIQPMLRENDEQHMVDSLLSLNKREMQALQNSFIDGFKAGQSQHSYTEADKWISLKDRFPENREWVISASYNEIFLAQYKHGVFWENDQSRVYNITHWQPLPAPHTK